jgi:hypothetical protein
MTKSASGGQHETKSGGGVNLAMQAEVRKAGFRPDKPTEEEEEEEKEE